MGLSVDIAERAYYQSREKQIVSMSTQFIIAQN